MTSDRLRAVDRWRLRIRDEHPRLIPLSQDLILIRDLRRAYFPRIVPATWANDAPLETATNRWVPMACGPNVDQARSSRVSWSRLVADASGAPVLLRDQDRSAGRHGKADARVMGTAGYLAATCGLDVAHANIHQHHRTPFSEPVGTARPGRHGHNHPAHCYRTAPDRPAARPGGCCTMTTQQSR